MSELSEFLKKYNRRDYSTRAIAEKASSAGHKMSHITASRYLAGKHPVPPNPDVLDGFAYVLGISSDKLYKIAELPSRGAPFTLPADAALLDAHERKAVLGVVNAFIRGKHDNTKNTTPATEAPEPAGNDQLDPDRYQNHRHLIEKYGDEAYQHQHDLAARAQKPGDDIEEIYE